MSVLRQDMGGFIELNIVFSCKILKFIDVRNAAYLLFENLALKQPIHISYIGKNQNIKMHDNILIPIMDVSNNAIHVKIKVILDYHLSIYRLEMFPSRYFWASCWKDQIL
jgi:hypothetical protein